MGCAVWRGDRGSDGASGEAEEEEGGGGGFWSDYWGGAQAGVVRSCAPAAASAPVGDHSLACTVSVSGNLGLVFTDGCLIVFVGFPI